MASDWRIVAEPLGRRSCQICGLAARAPSAATGASLYQSGYSLYAHRPGEPRERSRQAEYARWIARWHSGLPRRVVDVGCGNGSLLQALRAHWPTAELLGCDPSAESVRLGAAGDIRLWSGTASDLPFVASADLVISVNVIEHTADPSAFIAALRVILEPQGTLIVICPNGDVPDVELLIADHLFSFVPAHLRELLAREGFVTDRIDLAPSTLGQFQMIVAHRGTAPATAFERVQELSERRRTYLRQWRDLDTKLRERVTAPLICFGAGETAGLLRAYAPVSWALVRACTFDGASGGTFGDLPIVPLDDVSPDASVLVGVRPSDQRLLMDRLRSRFDRVITWHDLVGVPDGH